jgi:hypothetical protein
MPSKKDTPAKKPASKAKAKKAAEPVAEIIADDVIIDMPEEPTGSDAKPVEPKSAAAKSNFRLWLMVALLVAAFVGGLAVWPKYGNQIEGWLPEAWRPGRDLANQRVDEIAGALDELVARLARSETTLAGNAEDLAAVRTLRSQLETVLGQIAELQARAVVPGDLAARMAETDQRLDDLTRASQTNKAELAGLAARPPAAPAAATAPTAPPTDAAAARLPDDLAGRLTALEALPLDLAALSETVGKLSATLGLLKADNLTLQARLDKAEADLVLARTASGGNNSAAVLVAATGQLRLRAERGGAFAAELGTVQSLANPAGSANSEIAGLLADLQPHAATGVTTLETLSRSFRSMAGSLVQAAPQKADWLARAWARVTALVSVRRTGEVAGEGNEARVARAEARLLAGDLASAVDEVSNLTASAQTTVAVWLDQARARLAVEAALADLSRHAMARMARGTGK